MKPIIDRQYAYCLMVVFALVGILLGSVFGVCLTFYELGVTAEKVQVKNVEIGFNQTEMMDYVFQKINAQVPVGPNLLCKRNNMEFRYITQGGEIKCYNETVTAFYTQDWKETHRIEVNQ